MQQIVTVWDNGREPRLRVINEPLKGGAKIVSVVAAGVPDISLNQPRGGPMIGRATPWMVLTVVLEGTAEQIGLSG
jgi:hypothetical protein